MKTACAFTFTSANELIDSDADTNIFLRLPLKVDKNGSTFQLSGTLPKKVCFAKGYICFRLGAYMTYINQKGVYDLPPAFVANANEKEVCITSSLNSDQHEIPLNACSSKRFFSRQYKSETGTSLSRSSLQIEVKYWVTITIRRKARIYSFNWDSIAACLPQRTIKAFPVDLSFSQQAPGRSWPNKDQSSSFPAVEVTTYALPNQSSVLGRLHVIHENAALENNGINVVVTSPSVICPTSTSDIPLRISIAQTTRAIRLICLRAALYQCNRMIALESRFTRNRSSEMQICTLEVGSTYEVDRSTWPIGETSYECFVKLHLSVAKSESPYMCSLRFTGIQIEVSGELRDVICTKLTILIQAFSCP